MDNTREVLDALILLANSDNFIREMHGAKLHTLLACIKCPGFGETQTKVDTIAGQLASVDMADPGLRTAADEQEEEEAKTEEIEVG